MKSPHIFDFSEYRHFLRKHFEYKKNQNKNWSYGSWAKQLKLSNTSVISNIMLGRRSPGKKITSALTNYFKFDDNEKLYFEGLVQLDKRSHLKNSSQMIEHLQSKHRKKSHKISDEEFNRMSDWYFYALREMMGLADFKSDVKWFQKRIKNIKENQIQTAIELLIKHSLVKKDLEGNLRNSQASVETTTDVKNMGLRKFHQQMITLAKESIDSVPVGLRDITGITFNIKTNDLPEIKKSIQAFRKALCEKYESSSGEETYQLNVQLFPLTESEDKT